MKKLANVLLLLLIALPITRVEDKKEYTQTHSIYSEPLEEGNNYLSNVTIEGINFEFKGDITRYIIDVPYSKEKLDMNYTKADESAIVEMVGSNDLKVGENSIVLIVTNTAGNVREYNFTINRSDDRVNVINDEMAIQDGIENATSSKIVIELIGEASIINEDSVKALKNSDKTIVYEWKNADGKTLESLKIESSILKDDKEINPNIEKEITSEKLIKKMEGTDYIPYNTKGTNLPEGTSYTVYVDSDEDTFVLFSDKGGVITNRTLKNENGMVEFSIENDVEYALVSKSQSPESKVGSFGIIIPIVVVIILIGIFAFVYRKKIPEIMKRKYKKDENDNTER